MSLKYVKDNTLAVVTNIVDAQYQGDPAGTAINKSFMENNVHTYIKDLTEVVQPDRSYLVSPGYTSLGNPYFDNLADAIIQVEADGSSSGDKAFVKLRHGQYTDALTWTYNGYVVIEGDSSFGTEINGALTISTGVWIFKNIKFLQNISITGGTVIFVNCNQTSGTTTIDGASSVVIADAVKWGVIYVTGNNGKIFLSHISNISADAGDSIILAAGMTGGTYVVRHCEMEGIIRDDTPLTENTGNTESVTPIFSI